MPCFDETFLQPELNLQTFRRAFDSLILGGRWFDHTIDCRWPADAGDWG